MSTKAQADIISLLICMAVLLAVVGLTTFEWGTVVAIVFCFISGCITFVILMMVLYDKLHATIFHVLDRRKARNDR